MKLLDWMHRKFVQNSTETIKNSIIGNASTCFSVQTLFDEKYYNVEPTKSFSVSNTKYQNTPDRSIANSVEVLFQEELFESFDFLAIGTLGLDLPNTDPPTPTLPIPSEELINQHTEITENDLMLINYDLEKFLEAEKKETPNDTSERSSHASTITLNSRPCDGADSEGYTCMRACPLQNYLFANAIELEETDKEVKKERTSLAELFKRNSIAHDDATNRFEGAKQQTKKGHVAHFMKKLVKKIHSSTSSCTVPSKDDAAVSISIKKKLSKALKVFHKKVYPEEMTECIMLQRAKKKKISCEDGYQIDGDNENNKFPQAASKNCSMKLSSNSNGICKCSSTVNGEQWIRTDSEYLVLEF